MKIVVTGGAGFIGSSLVRHAIAAGHDVLTLDNLTYAGRLDALDGVMECRQHRFIRVDIADEHAVNAAINEFNPDAIFHLAAETHVDRSIDNAAPFIKTNVLGTYVLLEASLRHFHRLDDDRRRAFRFVHISTDEVFGELGDSGHFDSSSRYSPNSPYAASKASSDHFARAWYKTYGLPVIVTNCSNNYGPRQHSEKFIPTVIRHALEYAPIPVYGTGENSRDWLYVDDHAEGLLAVLRSGRPGETYLFGGRCEAKNFHLANTLCRILDARQPRSDGNSYAAQIMRVSDRPGHDWRYAIDPSQTETALGWCAAERLESGLAKTIDWYMIHSEWLVPVKKLGRLGLPNAVESES